LLAAALFLFPEIAGAAGEEQAPSWSEDVKAKVVSVDEGEPGSAFGATVQNLIVTVEIVSGDFKDQTVQIEHMVGATPYDIVVEPGDRVLLIVETDGHKIIQANIQSHNREAEILVLLAIFIAVLVVLGGIRGIKAALSLAFTVWSIMKIVLPLMIKGYDPVLLAVLVSVAASVFTLGVIGGVNKKTLSALIGTVGGVLAAGLLACRVGVAARLTGIGDEEAAMLAFIPQSGSFDYRGLLFAGIIIGALGAVMDVGMSVASSMDEIARVNPGMTRKALIKSGINVGRDMMGTMSNTLVLAYVGGSLPLLMLFLAYDTPAIRFVNLEMITAEIVRSLSGSVGVLLAVPVSAIAAGFILTRRKSPAAAEGDDIIAPPVRSGRRRRLKV